MSVPVSQRSESKLAPLMAVREMTVHTLNNLANERCFPTVYLRFIAQIQDLAVKIYTDLWAAYKIPKDSAELRAKRREKQRSASTDCTTLLALVDIAYRLFPKLEPRRIEYWSGLVLKARREIDALIKRELEAENSENPATDEDVLPVIEGKLPLGPRKPHHKGKSSTLIHGDKATQASS